MLEDLRGKGYSACDLDLILALFHTYTDQIRVKTNKKLQEELHIPTLMAKLTGNLSFLSPLIAPGQAIVNEITRQLQDGDSCAPRFAIRSISTSSRTISVALSHPRQYRHGLGR